MVGFQASLLVRGTGVNSGLRAFIPHRLPLVGSLNVASGQPQVDDGLSFDLLDTSPDGPLIPQPVRLGRPSISPPIIINRHTVFGIGPLGVPDIRVSFQTQAGQQLGVAISGRNTDIKFGPWVGGQASVDVNYIATPDKQLSQFLPEPIAISAQSTLSLLADLNLNSPVVGTFDLRLRGRAAVDDNNTPVVNPQLSVKLPPGIRPSLGPLRILFHGAQPEPGSLALVCLGTVALLRRRQRRVV